MKRLCICSLCRCYPSAVEFPNNDQAGFARYKELLKFHEAVGPLTAFERATVNLIKLYKQRSRTVQLKFLGYSSERAIISDTTNTSQTLAANADPPRTNTCHECTSSRKQSSLSKQHPLREQGRLRVGSQTITESYGVLLYCLQQYKSCTL